ncbi:hypothetical protein M422DRAFT_55270 [Sphaerobolus stellatus SS14]|uniref:Swi5-dependent recombination DNA repair protein 1 n=1 Tax=Sphaerobolus stellatus (strain SS14) TaxID=990650 RepID=A0A0C9TYS2_SPHS4|nr:hypothetical protein M422DRAFT_55270 [Sphaerobolus stellatus SS14]
MPVPYSPGDKVSSKHSREENNDIFCTPARSPSKKLRSTPISMPSATSFRNRHSKLLQPFRSPMLQISQPSHSSPAGFNSQQKTPNAKPPALNFKTPHTPSSSSPNLKLNALSKSAPGTVTNSRSALKPFKSPFQSPLTSLSSAIRNPASSPNIQALERKVQLLKRAIKIKEANEEETLEKLTKKWTTAGRDVAWELWAAVKDQEPDGNWGVPERIGFGKKGKSSSDRNPRGSDSNWGYDDDKSSELKGNENNEGSNTDQENENMRCDKATYNEEGEAEKKEKQAHNLGTMLRSFGVSDDILGWDKDGEDFVEVD